MNKEDQNGSMTFFKESIRSYNKLYGEMSRKLIEDGFNQDGEFDVQHYKQELETFKKYNNILLQIMQYQEIDQNATEMPDWLEMLIRSSNTG